MTDLGRHGWCCHTKFKLGDAGTPVRGEHVLDETPGSQVESSFRGVQMRTQFGGSRGMCTAWVHTLYLGRLVRPCGWKQSLACKTWLSAAIISVEGCTSYSVHCTTWTIYTGRISHGSYRRSDHRMRKAFKHSASGNSSMESTLVGSDLAFRVGPQQFHPAIRLCATYDWLKVSPSGYRELVICLCSGKIPTRGVPQVPISERLPRKVCQCHSPVGRTRTRPQEFCGSLTIRWYYIRSSPCRGTQKKKKKCSICEAVSPLPSNPPPILPLWAEPESEPES